ncbi:MAG TPA: VOC family protein [Streptosporangiaceae bacterium]|jgi:hypothetical protein|nr:VOC family protein [Streptosporangiaceae bacterium]
MLTTNFVPGAPNWVDLATPDNDAAAAFYGPIFGWEYQSGGPEAGGYGFFTLGGKTVAAVGPMMEPGGAAAWTLYFNTPDADATANAVTKAGGSVQAAMDVFTAGRMAQFTDPSGAKFAVWQPGDTKGLDAVTDPGTLTWTELHTADPEAAKAFYQSVFGWSSQDMPMGDFTYTVITPAGGTTEDSSQGGIMPLVPEMAASGSRWLPYFEVSDTDAAVAKASELGGTVIAPAMDIDGVGRMAAFADPAGALFSVIKSAQPS